MFGLNGRTLKDNLIGHYYVHGQGDPGRVHERTNIDESLLTINAANADVVGVCEIYEGQEEQMREGLRALGYNHFFFGYGHRFKHNNYRVVELLATKSEAEQYQFSDWPVENKLGGGGGFVVARVPSADTNIMFVHLGMPIRKYFKDQLKHVMSVLDSLEGNTILMGDFNYSWKRLQTHFPDWTLASGSARTCSQTPFLRMFYNKDIDHVLLKGHSSKIFSTIEGRSDHKLVCVDIE